MSNSNRGGGAPDGLAGAAPVGSIEDVTEHVTLSESGAGPAARPSTMPPLGALPIPPPRAARERIYGDRELGLSRRKGNTFPFLVAGVAAAAAALVAVVVIGTCAGEHETNAAAKPPADARVLPPPPDVVETVAQTIDAMPEIEIEPEVATGPAVPRHVPTPPRPHPLIPPTPEPPTSEPDRPLKLPPTADGCDEVSCVLDKYARACCVRFKPADPGPGPRPLGLSEDLDKSMIRSAVDTIRPVLIQCGETSTAKGTVRLAVTVRPDGRVASATVVASPDPGLGSCVAAAMQHASFPHTVNGGSFGYPFVF